MNVAAIVKAKGSRIVATRRESSIQRPSAGHVSAQILHMPPTSPRVWGLSPAERILQALRRAGIAEVVHGTAAPSCEGSLLILRDDIIYDGGFTEALIVSPDVLVAEASTPGALGLAAHVSAECAGAARRGAGWSTTARRRMERPWSRPQRSATATGGSSASARSRSPSP